MAYAHRAKNTFAALPFISTWRTSTVYTGSTANNQIKLPLEVAGTYKFTVNWGDSTSSVITAWDQAETLHTYPSPGDYTVTITGFIKGWDWGSGTSAVPTTGDRRKLLTVTQFGCLRFVSKGGSPLVWGAFYGCTNLNLTAVQDVPNFKGTASTLGFLRSCSAITTVNNINKWDVSRVTSFRSTLREMALFNDNIGNWNTGKGIDFIAMFFSGSTTFGIFNNGGSDSIKNWDTSNATSMANMFQNQVAFNQEIGTWDVGKVTSMVSMLGLNATTAVALGVFNNGGSSSINNWNTGIVTNMSGLFTGQRFFNQPIGNWDTSKVTNMQSMFYASNVTGFPGVFNQDIGNWNTGNVTNMSLMFVHQINFNQNIGNWNVGKVTNFSSFITGLLSGATTVFNNGGSPSINNWNTGLVTNMNSMFRFGIGFNQPIGNWNISLVTDFGVFMQNKTFNDYSAANYDALLIGWASRPVQANRSLNFNTIRRTAASTAARAILTSAPNNWTIVDGGLI